MECAVRGWPDDDCALRLDHERFAYAGKFVMTGTGKTVACEDKELLGAVAFNRDRTDATTAWLRYVTVRTDRRGEGIGARLLDFTAERLLARDAERVQIAVNNPFAFEAAVKAGFAPTGDRTGLAEHVLARPADCDTESYRAGLAAVIDRDDVTEAECTFVDRKRERGPPKRVHYDRNDSSQSPPKGR
jgi:GNAT superfamily N-acetyltransferase